jgi:hypothetical protein
VLTVRDIDNVAGKALAAAAGVKEEECTTIAAYQQAKQRPREGKRRGNSNSTAVSRDQVAQSTVQVSTAGHTRDPTTVLVEEARLPSIVTVLVAVLVLVLVLW